MAYTPHTRVKPEKLAAAAVQALEQSLTLPNLFRREGFEAYQGAKGDVVNMRVEGVLPFHNYAWRNDRSTSIVTDVYEERSISVGLADHFYSAVALTDEQKGWDLLDWGFLLGKQTRAVTRGLQHQAQDAIENAPYEVVIGGAEADLLATITETRRVMNRLQVPDGQRILVVGSDFDAALQNDDRIQLAQDSGDSNADSALRNATVGRLKEFTVVLDNTIDPDAAYAFVDGGFVWANAAPAVPDSIPFGTTTSFEGLAMRLMRDYVADKFFDRQVVDIFSGMRYVPDVLIGWDEANDKEIVSESEHFVRGVKLTLGGESTYPAVGGELATITGLSTADGMEDGVRGDISAA